jgi:murein DD-endopeptidase MepM/ murein hydrolase activator NlpD
LTAPRDRVKELSGDLAEMLDEGARLRLAAGLDRLHHEVLEVGVGGPGSRAPDEHPLWHTNPSVGEVAFTVGYDLSVLERRARLHRESLSEAGDSIHAHRERLFATPSIVPTHGRVSSSFSRSRNHPIHNRPMPHTGVDISAPRGTPILATARGRVTRAGWRAGYGLSVELDHGHTYSTLYAHASEVLVKVGDEVERGDVIARVGNTGTATAPHLHYEVLVNGRPQNPMGFVIPFGAP